MSVEQFQKSKRLFEEALGLAAQERGAFLERACGGDEKLRQEVESLLASSEKADGFLNRSHLATLPEEGSAPGALDRIGLRLGPYEVLSPLGAGGMGEVYRARDTRLGRDVAIKVLPAAVSRRSRSGCERFEQRGPRGLGAARSPQHRRGLRRRRSGRSLLLRFRAGRGIGPSELSGEGRAAGSKGPRSGAADRAMGSPRRTTRGSSTAT